MVQRYGIFLNNQIFPNLFPELNCFFLLSIKIFSYICSSYPKGKNGSENRPLTQRRKN